MRKPTTRGLDYYDLVEVDETLLTGDKEGRSHPEGTPYEYFLFCTGYKLDRKERLPKQGKTFVHTLEAATPEELDAALVAFSELPNVTLLGKDTR